MPAGQNVALANVDTTLMLFATETAAVGPSLGSELAGLMRRSSSSVVDFEAGCRP